MYIMNKEKFKELYENEMKELSSVETAINELGFQMNGKSDVHKNVLSVLKDYADSHKSETNSSNEFFYGYVTNKVVDNWKIFHETCFYLWNFPRMTKNSLTEFYDYIYSAFEMMEENTFGFDDYIDGQFQTYMTNLEKFFSKETCDEIWNSFISYLKNKKEWNEEFFKC